MWFYCIFMGLRCAWLEWTENIYFRNRPIPTFASRWQKRLVRQIVVGGHVMFLLRWKEGRRNITTQSWLSKYCARKGLTQSWLTKYCARKGFILPCICKVTCFIWCTNKLYYNRCSIEREATVPVGHAIGLRGNNSHGLHGLHEIPALVRGLKQ